MSSAVNIKKQPLTLALPKGRLMEDVQKLFAGKGLSFQFRERKLVAHDESKKIKLFLVKNSDLPTYVHHGIAGLGICGADALYESGYTFNKLMTFDFGSTTMCLARRKDHNPDETERKLCIATKFTHFTRDYFHEKGLPVQIIKLNGSVELAPVLGLAPYIVDLVETGSTLKANNLEVIDRLEEIKVCLIANPAYYKLHYREINTILDMLQGENV